MLVLKETKSAMKLLTNVYNLNTPNNAPLPSSPFTSPPPHPSPLHPSTPHRLKPETTRCLSSSQTTLAPRLPVGPAPSRIGAVATRGSYILMTWSFPTVARSRPSWLHAIANSYNTYTFIQLRSPDILYVNYTQEITHAMSHVNVMHMYVYMYSTCTCSSTLHMYIHVA